jgi:hypothetical protein
MTWGKKLIMVFIGFALLMSTMVYMCSKQQFDLVSKDYYSEELRYQDRIDATNNASRLSNVEIRQNAENVVIELPKEMQGLSVRGQVWFYCANDAANDRKIEIESDHEGKQFISKSKLAKTNYTVKVNWKSGDDNFYTEKKVSVQ